MVPQIVGSVLRAVLASYGGANLASDGEINQIIGAFSLIATVCWSVWQKYAAQRAAATPTA